jgi:hypothetical protein
METFSVKPNSSSPFLYSYLSTDTALSIATAQRQVAIGLAALQSDLSNFDADDAFEANQGPLSESGLPSAEIARRNRIIARVEQIKYPAVRIGWYVCRYKKIVRARLNQYAKQEEGTRVLDNGFEIVEAKIDHHFAESSSDNSSTPSQFLLDNHSNQDPDDGLKSDPCIESVLKSIIKGRPNSLLTIGSGRFLDFLEDTYKLHDNESRLGHPRVEEFGGTFRASLFVPVAEIGCNETRGR